MFDTEILNKDAVLLKCDEIKSKYLDIFDALISRDTIFATFKIEGMQDFTMQEKKYADLYLIFKDLENKYDYFAGIVELESVPQTIEPGTDAGFSFPYRRDLFEDGSLKDKIASFDAQLVECAGFAYSFPIMKARHEESDNESDKNAVDMEYEKTKVNAENLLFKIGFFKKILGV